MIRGKKTSELWLNIAYGVMLLANGTDYINVPADQMLALAGMFGVYTGGRCFVKATEGKKGQ